MQVSYENVLYLFVFVLSAKLVKSQLILIHDWLKPVLPVFSPFVSRIGLVVVKDDMYEGIDMNDTDNIYQYQYIYLHSTNTHLHLIIRKLGMIILYNHQSSVLCGFE